MDSNKLDANWPTYFEGCENLPGIPNLGASCFANAQMQVLNHTPEFLNYFKNYCCEKEECLRRRQNGEMIVDGEEECYHCLIKEYVEQVEYRHRNNTEIESDKFLNAVMRYTEQMQVKKASDGEELFMHIDDKLEIANQKSILSDIFYCKLATIYCCKNCPNEWRDGETTRLLVNKGNITDKLAELSSEKDVDCPRTCEKCQVQGDCTEKTVIDSPPHVLQIRLQTVKTFVAFSQQLRK